MVKVLILSDQLGPQFSHLGKKYFIPVLPHILPFLAIIECSPTDLSSLATKLDKPSTTSVTPDWFSNILN